MRRCIVKYMKLSHAFFEIFFLSAGVLDFFLCETSLPPFSCILFFFNLTKERAGEMEANKVEKVDIVQCAKSGKMRAAQKQSSD